VQFQPEALAASVRRLLAAEPQWLYLTHYGAVGGVPALGAQFLEQLDGQVALGESLADAAERHAALRHGLERLYLRRIRAHGVAMSDAAALQLLDMDIELNAQGMGIWLDRRIPTTR